MIPNFTVYLFYTESGDGVCSADDQQHAGRAGLPDQCPRTHGKARPGVCPHRVVLPTASLLRKLRKKSLVKDKQTIYSQPIREIKSLVG